MYFRVRNWENYQHYKDRNPPWIKLYNYLLEDYEFSQLSDNAKLHLMLIWMLASRLQNKLPYDEKWIQTKIDVKGKVNLDELLKHRYIEKIDKENNVLDDASKMLAECKQVAIPETETETETETYVDFDFFWDLYPRKEGDKKRAKKDWDSYKITNEFFETVVKNHFQKSYKNIQKQYIPHGSTYVSQKRWENEVVEYQSPKKQEQTEVPNEIQRLIEARRERV